MIKKIDLTQITAYLLSFLLLMLPLVYISDLRDPSSLPRYAVIGISSGIFITLIAYNAFIKKRIYISHRFLIILIFLCFAWSSLKWSFDINNSLIELLQLTSFIILSGLAINIFNSRFQHLPLIASTIGATLASIIGIMQYFLFNPFDYFQVIIPSSTFTNTNFFSIYIDLILPISFIFIFIAKTNAQRFLASFSTAACLSFILVSHTRGSWLSLLITFIIFIFFVFQNKNIRTLLAIQLKTKLSYILFPFVFSSILFFIPPPDIGETELSATRKNSQLVLDNSSKIRLNAYINSLSLVQDYPIAGVGYGAFRAGFRNYMFDTVPLEVVTEDNALFRLHNDILQNFVELGFIGGLLFLSVYLLALNNCWTHLTDANSKKNTVIILGVFLALIAGGIHSLFDFPLHKPTSAAQFWLLIGFSFALSAKKVNLNNRIRKYFFSLLFVFGVMFTLYNFSFYKNYITASYYRLETQKSLINSDCKLAKNLATRMFNKFNRDYLHLSLYVTVYSKCNFNPSITLQAMDKALKQAPTNTRALITQGALFLQLNKINKANGNFLKVTKLLPHRASGYIGLAYVELYKKNKAKLILQHALELEPKNKVAADLLLQLTSAK